MSGRRLVNPPPSPRPAVAVLHCPTRNPDLPRANYPAPYTYRFPHLKPTAIPSHLVTLRSGQATTTTLEIAAGTQVTHEAVILSVRKYKEDLERFGGVRFEFDTFQTAGGPQKREIAILNERQATLLISYQRNTEVVRAFKVCLVEGFYQLGMSVFFTAIPITQHNPMIFKWRRFSCIAPPLCSNNISKGVVA